MGGKGDKRLMWSHCAAVEAVPGKVSGVPVVKGTRVPAQAVLDNFDAGVTEREIADMYDVPLATVRIVIDFAKSSREPSPA